MSDIAAARVTPITARPKRKGPWLHPYVDRAIATILPFAIWQIIAEMFPFAYKWFSSPVDVIDRIYDMVLDGSLWVHSWQTFQEAIIGLILGVLLGTIIGVILGRWKRGSDAVDPIMMGMYSLPRVSLAPLFILWLGIGLMAKVALVISIVMFLVLLNVREGVRQIDPDMFNALKTMGASRSMVMRHVILPSLVPWIITSVRISIGAALIGAVVGELMGASQGLGWYVTYAAGIYDITGSITGLVLLGIMAMILNTAVAWIENKALYWRTPQSGGSSDH
jgi:NitT/TauT family transport system permease protein